MKNKTTIFSSKCMYYSTFRQSSHVAYRVTHQKLVESHGLLMATYVETMKRPRTEDLMSLPDPQDVLAPHTLHTIQGSATPVYSRSDYPNVRYWYKEAWRQVESKRKDSSNLGSNASIRGGTRCAQGENVSTTYIEESDGTPIPGLRAAEIREFARSIWKGLYSRGLAPPQMARCNITSTRRIHSRDGEAVACSRILRKSLEGALSCDQELSTMVREIRREDEKGQK